MSEPQDARPKWMDENAQDEVPARTGTEHPLPLIFAQWQHEASMRERQRKEDQEYFTRADPEQMAVRELVNSADAESRGAQHLHATRAAAWASLAVLRELKAHRPAETEPQDKIPD